MNIFDSVNSAIQNAENSFVNLVSAIAPWLAPIAPAYMTYQHATEVLHFPFWVAFPVSVVVEILGFSAVSTFMAFWFFNRKNKASGKKAPISFVVFAFFFYLALIVTSNILLDTFPDADWAIISARALFTLQTIPAALIVISRTGHKSLLAEIAKETSERDANHSPNRSQMANDKANDTPNENAQANEKRTLKSLTPTERAFVMNNESKIAAEKLGVTPRAVQKWRKDIQGATPPPFPMPHE